MPERKRSFSTDVFPNLNMTVVAKKSRCWTGPRPVIKFGKEKYFVVVAISVGRQKSVRTTALSVVSQRYEWCSTFFNKIFWRNFVIIAGFFSGLSTFWMMLCPTNTSQHISELPIYLLSIIVSQYIVHPYSAGRMRGSDGGQVCGGVQIMLGDGFGISIRSYLNKIWR